MSLHVLFIVFSQDEAQHTMASSPEGQLLRGVQGVDAGGNHMDLPLEDRDTE
jgi:hypothetical protein